MKREETLKCISNILKIWNHSNLSIHIN